MFVYVYFIWSLCTIYFADLTWEKVYSLYEESNCFEMCISLSMTEFDHLGSDFEQLTGRQNPTANSLQLHVTLWQRSQLDRFAQTQLGSVTFQCLITHNPSKHAGYHSESFWLRSVMAIITATVQLELGLIVYAGSDFPNLIRIHSSKESLIILYKTGPDPVWMAWPRFGPTNLVWKQAGVQEPSGPVLAERNRPATSFPLSDSAAVFHRWPGS